MSPQTAVADNMNPFFDGMVHDEAEREVSGLADALVFFGKLVTQKVSAGDDLPPVVLMYDITEGPVQGIAVADPTVERLYVNGVPAEYGAFAADTGVRIVRKGRVWVKLVAALTTLLEPVLVKNAVGSTTDPDLALGSFNGAAATNYVEVSDVLGLSWAGKRSIGTDHYGLLEINIPGPVWTP